MTKKINLKNTIYVKLLNEGTLVWRPVEAIVVGERVFKIISTNQNPDDEKWEFTTGDIVRCTQKSFSEGLIGLAATEKINETD